MLQGKIAKGYHQHNNQEGQVSLQDCCFADVGRLAEAHPPDAHLRPV